MDIILEVLKWSSLALAMAVVCALIILGVVFLRGFSLMSLRLTLAALFKAARPLWRVALTLLAKLVIWKYVSAWWRKKRKTPRTVERARTHLWQNQMVFLLLCFGLATFLVRSTRLTLVSIPWSIVMPYAIGVVILILLVAIALFALKKGLMPSWSSWRTIGKVAASAAILLLVVYGGYQLYHYVTTPGNQREYADTTKYDTITPEHPVEAVMEPDTQIDVSVDLQKVDQKVVWRDRKDGLKDKVRIFTAKPGVEKVNISIRTYPCSTASQCREIAAANASPQSEEEDDSQDEPPPLPDGIPTEPIPHRNPYGEFGRPNKIPTSY